ncbi:MAG TPA: pyrroline-5-carboxylate reductase dimerization domain-containing protein [Candidatus Sulfotelmatobacter sp.]|nr:pyrroline-5-carboxylate reductase dimerization domain-containing protein [Candidatus Sulfotelmatobacter sp.]
MHGLKAATVFLGGGRITSALCAGLRRGGFAGDIAVYDRNPEKLRLLRKESHVEIARDLESAVARAQLLIVAVRPSSVGPLLAQVSATGAVAGLCVSLAAGIPLSVLRKHMPTPARWVRAMPSPVCRVGRGLTAISFDRPVSLSQRKCVCEFFERVGQVVEVPERRLDAFTAAYSSSHGYHALAALASAAQRAGLDRKTALIAAAHALADGIQYWRESGLGLDQLLREAATPGGIAAATLQAMDRAGYAALVAKGIQAGVRQAKQNARASHPALRS